MLFFCFPDGLLIWEPEGSFKVIPRLFYSWQVKGMIEQLITKMQEQVGRDLLGRGGGFDPLVFGSRKAKGSRYVLFCSISLVFITPFFFGHLLVAKLFLTTNLSADHWLVSQLPGVAHITIRKAKEEATKKGWCDTELSSNKAIREEKTDAVESLQSDIDEMTAQIAKLGNEVELGEGRLSVKFGKGVKC